ncbi:MAG: iron-sulfur cluster repair di-iron protein [Sandaracinaceae bacterium]|nr:iron-sulfur cluster repair di-iron protein [Sandaracinaceae bacterium]
MITNDIRLADLATHIPGAAGVLRRHRLDFCCKGQQTLEAACEARGVDLEALKAALEALDRGGPAPLEELAALSPPALVDHIERRYHEPLRPAVQDLLALARRVEQRHGERADCPRGLAALLERGAVELDLHLSKEEHVLFPAVRRGMTRELLAPVSMMEHEHEEHGRFLEELRRTASDFVPPPDACNSWRALYLGLADLENELLEHILVENHLLFPRLRG